MYLVYLEIKGGQYETGYDTVEADAYIQRDHGNVHVIVEPNTEPITDILFTMSELRRFRLIRRILIYFYYLIGNFDWLPHIEFIYCFVRTCDHDVTVL